MHLFSSELTGQSRQGHKSVSSGNQRDNSVDTIGHNLALTKRQFTTFNLKGSRKMFAFLNEWRIIQRMTQFLIYNCEISLH